MQVPMPAARASTASNPAAAALLRRVGRGLLRLERERICCGSVTRQQFDTLRALDGACGAEVCCEPTTSRNPSLSQEKLP